MSVPRVRALVLVQVAVAVSAGSLASSGERWERYVSGTIAEIHLPCTHADMTRPEKLAQVWSGKSGHFGLEESI